MRKIMVRGMAAVGAVCLAGELMADPANPQISNVTASQDSQRLVTVTYDLDEPAIVTMDVLTNGVSIGAENIRYVSGDCNQIVSAGSGKTINWIAHQSWPGHKFTTPVISFRVKAWATDAPPDIMVVDLTGSGGAGTQRYYEHIGNLPGGILGNEVYRRSLMVMRRVHAADVTWTMGNITDGITSTIGRKDDETAHTVTLANDYYMSVFETTQKQWQTLMGEYVGYYQKSDCRDMRPAENVSYAQVRGADYPSVPAEGTFVAAMRTKTGFAFDLPSEAQWEFACRGGLGEGVWNTGVAYNFAQRFCNNLTYKATSGRNITYWGTTRVGGDKDPYQDVNTPGRWSCPGNCWDTWGGVDVKADAGTWTGTAIVGSYAPSVLGFYDMHGNVAEMCLDKYVADITANTRGEVSTSGTDYVVIGGFHTSASNQQRSCSRTSFDGTASKAYGVRLICPIAAQ